MRAAVVSLLLVLATPAFAAPGQETPAEQQIRAVIAQWYAELAKEDQGRVRDIVAPGFIDATPHYRYIDTGAAKLGRRVYTSLPAEALQFAYDIDAMRIDPNFAKVDVWERGYFYAFAAQQTYERALDTAFILERRQDDGGWLITAHQSGSYGIPPNKITVPMPDLRDLYYATEGKGRDPEADALNAGKF